MRDSHGLPELMPPAAAVPGSLAGFHSARAGPVAAPCLSAAEGAALQPRQGHADVACTGQAAAGRDGACCPGTLPQTWAAAGADLTAAYQSRCPVLGPLGCVRVPQCLDSCAALMAWPDWALLGGTADPCGPATLGGQMVLQNQLLHSPVCPGLQAVHAGWAVLAEQLTQQLPAGARPLHQQSLGAERGRCATVGAWLDASACRLQPEDPRHATPCT